jgi:putative membrane protein
MSGLLLQVLPALAALGLYLRRARTLAPTPRAVPRWRIACFVAGTAVVTGAVTGLGAPAERTFAAHMVEHLLIVDVGALLLVLGLTGPLLAPVLRVALFDRLRVLAHPLVALPLWALNLYAWHVPALHEAAVRDDALHATQHLLFLATGANVWMCLVGPLPRPAWFGTGAMAAYVVGVRLAGTVLANALLFGGEAFYDVYEVADAERDQQVAAGIMMVEESVLTIVLFGWLFLRAARLSEERQALLDLARERGVPLDERRAARAVAAGRGALLERRLREGAAGDPDRTP